MTLVAEWNALTCIYAAALLMGFLYALFLIFFQGVGHAFHIDLDGHHFDLGGHQVDLGHAGGHDLHAEGHDNSEATGLSMLAISGFVTAFGAFGLAATGLLHAGVLVSLGLAILGGVAVGAAAQLLFIRVLSTTTSSNLDLSALKGSPAQIITPIPADGMGQIAFVLRGQRVTLSARSSSETSLPRGTQVIIDGIRDGVAYVSPGGED